ncbi:DNA mismatch endonuclease vsr [Mycobacteroides abscessus subsp. abscessus]|nr:DNA mismatch endonuclease vsr [Mycobacteroides abscessus subsp. abscessus]SHS29577.1 DNA mismatch endonuclease vsr [Mycobacteroides abscessus subsp. abscessus]SHS69708.1 DNA mismatch endonuclease vsr [Mycobacteroides abscessus subsp. abscessus]SKF26415.1 DNA mismatch endonuclease vsr [Mycobacteroides abscessus subsp. abscessus]SKG09069.1 DNA mismatch endonuclease vsr [Mycobacteroides abscessus subsp. abscessus]
MLANKGRDTRPELALRTLLHARGLRYRVNFRPLSGRRNTADVVFTKARVAVFVDGCFWHGCPEHLMAPKSNTNYWGPKIERNRERDAEFSEVLKSAGWTVVRFWEHDNPVLAADYIEQIVRAIRREDA